MSDATPSVPPEQPAADAPLIPPGAARSPEGGGTPAAPDLDATGAAVKPPGDPGTPGRETQERQAAWRRGGERAHRRAEGREAPREALGPRLTNSAVAHQAFAALAENVRDYAIFLMDPNGVITFWGEGARLMKWWTRDQAEGAHLRLLYPDGGSEDGTAEAHLEESAARGEYTGEGRRVRSDGSTFWAGVTLTALKDENGTLLGFAKVTRDLTARRAADAALLAARDAAERANRTKSEFLRTMSHEVRTPINAILGYQELLELGLAGPLTDEQRHYLARSRESGRHLLQIVDDLLDLARLEAGRPLSVRLGLARLGDAVRTALDTVVPQAAAAGVHVTNAVSGRAAGLAYWGDEGRVRQVLVNLLTNAVKFTERGGHVTVSAGTAERPSPGAAPSGTGPWAYVRVEDTGVGIAPERLATLFEPFTPGDASYTRRWGGAGLGLSISRQLARQMGGDLTARSTLGIGSTFFFWLPAAVMELLATGGVEGHGPYAGTSSTHPPVDAPPIGTLAEAADAIRADLERTLAAFVARLGEDPETPSARRVSEAELTDHLITFLADVAQTLSAIDVAGGQPGEVVRDGSAIQSLVAERHGAQRAQLGWTEQEVRREFAILGEELATALRRNPPRGPTPAVRAATAERAIEALAPFLAAAEAASVGSFQAALRRESAGNARPRRESGA